MRSKPRNPNKGKVTAVLAVLAIIWLVGGTLFFLKVKDVIVNGTYSSSQNVVIDDNNGQNADDAGEQDDSSIDDIIDDADGQDDFDDDVDDADDLDDTDDYADDTDDLDDTDDDVDDADDIDDDNVDDDVDEDDHDDDDDVLTFTVDAWDGFAAVRTGRGTGYSQVGRLNNGEKVKVTDLENGWYKIAKGKWKGYYLHKSSLK